MTVLVTGAAGFIGAALCQHLARRGDQILGIDNLNSYYDIELKKARVHELTKFQNIQFQIQDICDPKGLKKLYAEYKPDRIVHLAAQAGVRYSLENPALYIQSNVDGFLNVLELARHYGTQHLLFASSSSVYGANTKMPYSPHDPTNHPVSLYAATKKSNELMAHAYSSLFRIPITGLRFFTVYGPWGRPDMAVFSFTKKILNGETVEIFNHGHHRRDFTYIEDIVCGVAAVLGQPAQPAQEWSSHNPDPASSSAPFKIYNIGNHQPVVISECLQILEDLLGKKAKTVMRQKQPGDVDETYADISDLQRDFGFTPNTSLREGLNQFVKWYKGYYLDQ